METGTPYTPPITRTTLRRSAIAALVVGALAVAVLIPMGYLGYALFGCLGLGLGLLNSALVVRSVERFSETKPSKVRFSGSVLIRLAAITVLAFGLVLLFRPEGVGVFGGLAVFQLIAIASSMLPLIKEIRQK
ncbi:MAG: ATP synthase subunit I [Actinomycetota bacterium]|nr:ATP synthase subunit I [Actinomycetota bacterium]